MAINEFDTIATLAKALGAAGSAATTIGDDGVLLPKGAEVVVTDTSEQDIHFRRSWSSLCDIAYRALATNVSDMLAMGAAPGAWLLNLTLPQGWSDEDTAGLIDGFRDCVTDWGVGPLIGGDTLSRATHLALTVTLFGALEGSAPWLRSRFLPGHLLWIDGVLGHAAAGLESLSSPKSVGDNEAILDSCRLQHRRPRPPESRAAAGVTGAIDVSDGLSSDLWHCARASGVTLVVDQPLPGSAALLRLASGDRERVKRWQWDGGDDYVRVVSAPARPAPHWQPIGRVEQGEVRVVLREHGREYPIDPRGWVHG